MNRTMRRASRTRHEKKKSRHGFRCVDHQGKDTLIGTYTHQRHFDGQPQGSFKKTGSREERVEGQLADTADLYEDATYAVAVYRPDAKGFQHITIQRKDGTSLRDWRDLQRIKTDLVGAEREAVELFPAESRLVDLRNTYHLWVIPEGKVFSFGIHEGRLTNYPGGQP